MYYWTGIAPKYDKYCVHLLLINKRHVATACVILSKDTILELLQGCQISEPIQPLIVLTILNDFPLKFFLKKCFTDWK